MCSFSCVCKELVKCVLSAACVRIQLNVFFQLCVRSYFSHLCWSVFNLSFFKSQNVLLFFFLLCTPNFVAV